MFSGISKKHQGYLSYESHVRMRMHAHAHTNTQQTNTYIRKNLSGSFLVCQYRGIVTVENEEESAAEMEKKKS